LTKLWYTKHSGKLAGLWSLSTSPLLNPFCTKRPTAICGRCYAQTYAKFRKGLEARLEDNYLLLQKPLPDDDLIVPAKVGPHLRLHSFGELGSYQHGANFVRLARLNPQIQMTLWTKVPEYLGPDVPPNLSVLYSAGALNLSPDEAERLYTKIHGALPFIKGLYYVGTKDHGFTPCGTRCLECLRCYPPQDGALISQLLH